MFKIVIKHKNKMSLDSQKMDPSQRQQIMATVQQQMALQHAQEILQVMFSYILYIFK